MKNYFKFNIDELVDEHAGLLIKRQNILDRKNETNSKIGTQIKKLENKAFILNEQATREIAEIDRILGKIERQLENEKIYINSLNVKRKEAVIPSFAVKDFKGGNK